jgi:hypothetical protein
MNKCVCLALCTAAACHHDAFQHAGTGGPVLLDNLAAAIKKVEALAADPEAFARQRKLHEDFRAKEAEKAVAKRILEKKKAEKKVQSAHWQVR